MNEDKKSTESGQEEKNTFAAFISYKHAEKDSAVAAEIQKGLEHFHVPNEIRKKTGKKKIGRVFRDKEELALTDDLSEEIQRALSVSSFLILICSGNTAKSVWVNREILFFLKNHTIENILTVIIEGEPKDVLPACLLDAEKEPLSADYRLPKKEARRTELPRIAAAVLGCGYDDLMQRSHQYMVRRYSALTCVIAAVSITAVVYLSWSRTQIANSLSEAQMNQVKYLSSEVDTLLEEDRDVTAARLALHTVPENHERTPAQSFRALARASGAYIPKTWNRYYRVKGELKSADDIDFIRENHARNKICTSDDTNHIHVWDAEKQEDILAFQETETVEDSILAGNMVIVGTENHLTGYDLSDGGQKWTIERGAVLSGSGQHCLQTDEDEKKVIAINSDNTSPHNQYISVIDPEDGKILQDISLDDAAYGIIMNPALAVSNDGNYAAFCLQGSDYESYVLYIADLKKGQLTATEDSFLSAGSLSFSGNGMLIARGITQASDNGWRVYGFDSFLNTAGALTAEVFYVDPASGKNIWTSDLEYNLYDTLPMQSGEVTYRDAAGENHDMLYITAANVLQLYELKTGKKADRYELSDCISLIEENTDASGSLSSFLTICRDGNAGTIMPGNSTVNYFSAFQNAIREVFPYKTDSGDSGYIVRLEDSDTVLQYSNIYYDTDFCELKDDDQTGSIEYFTFSDSSYIAVRSGKEYADEAILQVYDRQNKKLLREFSVPYTDGITDPVYIGLSEDGGSLIYKGERKSEENDDESNADASSADTGESDGEGVFAVSLHDGTVKRLRIPLDESAQTEIPTLYHSTYLPDAGFILRGDDLYYISEGGYLCSYNMESGQTTFIMSVKAPDDNQDTSVTSIRNAWIFSISPDGMYAFVSFEDGGTILLDIKAGKRIADVKTEKTIYTDASLISDAVDWDVEGGRFAVAGENAVFIFDLEGNVIGTIPNSGTWAVGIHFYKDMLLVVYNDAYMNRYSSAGDASSENLRLLGRTELDKYTSGLVSRTESVDWIIRENGTICAVIGEYMNVIDTDEWITLYSVPECRGYDEENSLFIVETVPFDKKTGSIPGYYPEYTLDNLIEKCRKAGHGQDLDEETLARYGLN